MNVGIDRAGRIVVPKKVREALGLSPGMALEMDITGMWIELVPKSVSVRFEKRGMFLVAVPEHKPSMLRQSQVNQTLEALREEDIPIT